MSEDELVTAALQDVFRLTQYWGARLDEDSPLAEDLAKLGGAAMNALELRLPEEA